MEFSFAEALTHSARDVYLIMRDRMTEVVPLVPNVESIEVLEREERPDGRLHVLNRWQGSPSATPRAIRPFVKPEYTAWLDDALWDDKRSLVEWKFLTEHLGGLYRCEGINYFEDNGKGGCTVRLTGTFELYPEKVAGMPKMLARKIAPVFEKWLLGLVAPNLSEAPRSVQAFLDQQ